MISYHGVPLRIEDPDGAMADFVAKHLPLEQLNLFGPPSHLSDLRHQSQGNHSHVMGLPTPNYPATPPLRLNTLHWPTGAMRYSTFIGVASDWQVNEILKLYEADPSGVLSPGQLVIADSQCVIPTSGFEHEFETDLNNRTALSVEMFLLTPRKITGLPAPPLKKKEDGTPNPPDWYIDATGNPDDKKPVLKYQRLWLLPFVDVRYFWQTTPTPSWLFSNVRVTGQHLTDTDDGAYTLEFVGTKRNTDINLLTANGGGATVIAGTDGSLTPPVNELQNINVAAGSPVDTFTLEFQPPGAPLPPTQTTPPIPNTASPEEIEDAISQLPAFRVTWNTLLNNIEALLKVFDQASSINTIFSLGSTPDNVIADEWGWPDRTELDRRHESIAAVLDAVANSIGRRVVRDISGVVRIGSARGAKDRYDSNLSALSGPYQIVAGGESLSYDFGGIAQAPDGIKKYRNQNESDEPTPTGCYVPEFVDVVYRDLTRGTQSGHFTPPDIGDINCDWDADAGFLTCSIKPEAGISDDADAKWSLIAPSNARVIKGWRKTIHTPTLNNSGKIPGDGDAYSDLALFIAGSVYDWAAYVFDWDFLSVMAWKPTGYDDFVEWSLGQRLDDGSYRAETRVQSMPFNFGVSTMLVQIGTQRRWAERFVQGFLLQNLDRGDNPVLAPKTARALLFLPAMELQGEDEDIVLSKRLFATVATRSIDAARSPGTFFEALSWFRDKNLVWLDCTVSDEGAQHVIEFDPFGGMGGGGTTGDGTAGG